MVNAEAMMNEYGEKQNNEIRRLEQVKEPCITFTENDWVIGICSFVFLALTSTVLTTPSRH
jgi:hypothetical protein